MSEPTTHIAIRLERGDFCLDVDVGWDERVAVVFGPSGSGKSTLFEAVLGLHRFAQSSIRLNGVCLDAPGGPHVPPHRRDLGWVPQAPALFPHLSVRENVNFGRARASARDPQALTRAIDVLEIGDLLDRSVDQLSGGERQRVAIARALASGPRALLMDEPLASLDIPLRARVLPYLLRVRDELDLPILYITHDPDEALLVGEVALVLDAGRVVAQGPPREVLWSRAVLPLSEALGIENVFDGHVADAGGEPQLVTPSGFHLQLPFRATPGDAVRIGLRAEDVVLSADPPGRISARNVFSARVAARDDHAGDVFVRLEVGDENRIEAIVAKVTPAAAANLELAPGQEVYAIIKAQALRRVG